MRLNNGRVTALCRQSFPPGCRRGSFEDPSGIVQESQTFLGHVFENCGEPSPPASVPFLYKNSGRSLKILKKSIGIPKYQLEPEIGQDFAENRKIS